MVAPAELSEYRTEIRKQVCSRCVERPEGGPPCEPLGKYCGVELHLPELIDSIHDVKSNLLAPYLDHDREQICATCEFLGSDICPCPMDYLLSLIVEAVETVDSRKGLPEVEKESLVVSDGHIPDAEEIAGIFQEAAGTWTGCDWPTKFGKAELNLLNCTSQKAADVARELANTDAGQSWKEAAKWLAQIEQHARRAEAHAREAVLAAESDNWRAALDHAERAWALEFSSGRAIWREEAPTWQRLRQTVQKAAAGRLMNAEAAAAK